MSAASDGASSELQARVVLFKPDPDLTAETWAAYVEQNEEKFFRKYVRGLVGQWEREVCPGWDALVAARLKGQREVGPSLAEQLPEELLAATSKFLIVAKDLAEQSELSPRSVEDARDIVKCLTIICR